MVGPCSYCGPYNQYCGHQTDNNTYFWPTQYETEYTTSSYSSSSSSPVDCTLSLGTPSTRLSNVENDTHYASETNYGSTTPSVTKHRNSVSSFCWDLLHPSKHSSNNTSTPKSRGGGGGGNGGGGDALFAGRCSNCDTTSTPLWRNGPRGPKSLCNACGIRFKKEERRAAAAATTTTTTTNNNQGMIDQHHGYYNAGSWAHQGTAQQKMQCYGAPNEFRFMEDDRGSDTGIQFLSWLTHDRPSGLVHEFTR